MKLFNQFSKLLSGQLRIFVAGVVFFILLLGLIKVAISLGAFKARPAAPIIASHSQQVIVKSYEDQAGPIVKTLLTTLKDGTTDDALKAIATAQAGLLPLTVPAQYKDVHLNLILSLTALEKGYRGDSAKLKEGQNKLQAVISPYPWLQLNQ